MKPSRVLIRISSPVCRLGSPQRQQVARQEVQPGRGLAGGGLGTRLLLLLLVLIAAAGLGDLTRLGG